MSRSVYVDNSSDQHGAAHHSPAGQMNRGASQPVDRSLCPEYSSPPAAPSRSAVQPHQDANSISMPTFTIDYSVHAAPLMSLRERDLKELTSLFAQTGIEAIEEDIKHNLLWRCPEPCWEDDPFDFLREFL